MSVRPPTGQRLGVVPSLEVVLGPDGEIIVVTQHLVTSFAGIDPQVVARLLQRVARGDSDVPALRAALADDLDADSVDALVDALYGNSIVDVELASDDASRTASGATPLVIGEGVLADAIAARLPSYGFSACERAAIGGGDDPSSYVFRAVVEPGVGVSAVVAEPLTNARLDALSERVAFAVVVSDGASRRAAAAAVDACERAGIPALCVWSEPSQLVVGPTVVPGCATCAHCALASRFGAAGALLRSPTLLQTCDTAIAIDAAVAALGQEARLIHDNTARARFQSRVEVFAYDGARTFQRLAAQPECARCGAARALEAPVAQRGFRWRGGAIASPLQDTEWSHPRSSDPLVPELVDVLRGRDAARMSHAIASLLDHLVGTHDILTAWRQPPALARAGLFHSCYQTEAFVQPLFTARERGVVRELIGPEAEELVFAFCTIDRAALLADVGALASLPTEGVGVRNFRTGETTRASSTLVAQLLIIEMANLADQAAGDALSPGGWVGLASRWGALAAPWLPFPPPVFADCTAVVSRDDEARARVAYLRAVSAMSTDPAAAGELVATAIAANPWVAEPYIIAGELARAAQPQVARAHGVTALDRLASWGTSWDKRQSWRAWMLRAVDLARCC